jgi:hypothetical protein
MARPTARTAAAILVASLALLRGATSAGICAAPSDSLSAVLCTACSACCADLSDAACDECQINQCGARLQCDPAEEGGCTVCQACCHAYFRSPADCSACNTAECARAGGSDGALELPLHLGSAHRTALLACVLLPLLCRSVPVLLSLWCANRAVGTSGRGEPGSDSDTDSSSGGSSGDEDEDEERRGLAEGASPSRAPGFMMSDLCSEESSWSTAMERSGLLRCGALALAALRLLVLHALQPASYLLALAVCSHDLSTLQLWLGGIVACRECLYLLATCRCIFANPAFLLVDASSSVTYVRELESLSVDALCTRAARVGVRTKEIEKAQLHEEPEPELAALIVKKATVWHCGYSFATMYTLAPEKYVAAALLDKGGLNKRGLFGLSWLVYALCDLCAVAALSAGLQRGALLPTPLIPGYVATVLAMLCWMVALGTTTPPSLPPPPPGLRLYFPPSWLFSRSHCQLNLSELALCNCNAFHCVEFITPFLLLRRTRVCVRFVLSCGCFGAGTGNRYGKEIAAAIGGAVVLAAAMPALLSLMAA